MVLTRVKIGEFDQFWSVFSTRGAKKRAEHGSGGARVFRNSDDSNEVFVLFDWDRDGFEAFLGDPEVAEIMRAGGLQGRPEPTFVEQVGELES